MQIDVYADIACPWCYIGGRRLEQALAQRQVIGAARRWWPFQLQPGMPAAGVAWSEFAERKFGGLDHARQIYDHVTTMGAEEGITFDFDRMASAPNTADAHRLILYAKRHGLQWEAVEALFAAYFTEGRNLNDQDALVEIAVRAGLDADAARLFVQSDELADDVRASQEWAYRLGVTSVPLYVFESRIGVSGAQPVSVFLDAIDMALALPETEAVDQV